ncbi:MAG: twin-arginine translocation signal domain-containing protein [Nitrososphaerota archaeon]
MSSTSRRRFIAAVGGAAVVAAVAGVAAYTAFGPKPIRKLRYSTHPFYFPQDAEVQFEKEVPNTDVEVTYEEFFVMTQKQLANPQVWDVASSGRYRIIIDGGVVQPIPADKVPRWQSDKVLRIFREPKRFLKVRDLSVTVSGFKKLTWFDL